MTVTRADLHRLYAGLLDGFDAPIADHLMEWLTLDWPVDPTPRPRTGRTRPPMREDVARTIADWFSGKIGSGPPETFMRLLLADWDTHPANPRHRHDG